MSEGQRDPLERELETLGPLMRDQEAFAAMEPDPEFVRTLRARLTGAPAPRRAVAARPRKHPLRRWMMAAGGLATLAAAAVVLLLLLGRSSTPSTHQVAFRVPTPDRNAVLRAYPVVGLGGGSSPPWSSNLDVPPGIPFAGSIHFPGVGPSRGPSSAPAFALQGPHFDVPRLRSLARALGIRGPVRYRSFNGDRFAYVVNQSSPSAAHSLAISLVTGKLIYHDTRSTGSGSAFARVTPAAIAAARRWIARLGWPASNPVFHPVSPNEQDAGSFAVQFGWTGAIPADLPAAVIVMNAAGRVIDAQLYPPVARRQSVSVRSAAVAWQQVRRGRVPLAVLGLPPQPTQVGRGVLRHTSVLALLTSGQHGRLYLVPAYHFSGDATFASGRQRWYAIIPAAR
ncbi:MAG TPA: hypothetical protein VKX16_05680 [Chloroflexota bacterium]|nr:hypothetical protein [Chloroflexota bacterium]